MRWFLCDLKWNTTEARPPIECACRAHAEAMYYMGGYQGNSFIYAFDDKRKVGTTILWHDSNGITRAEDWAPLTKHTNFLESYLKPSERSVVVDAAE